MSNAPQGYASEQPAGFKNRIENVAIVGAGGRSGYYMVEALLKSGKHTITAITRAGSPNKVPAGVLAKQVDYDDHASLVAALQGQDALIITLAVTAPPDQQRKLVAAAAAAAVAWILPNEFGGDGARAEVNRDIALGTRKSQERAHIEQLGASAWIGLACGFWYEFSLGGNAYRYGFDIPQRTATFFDEGAVRLNTSTFPQVGRAVAALLGLKVLPDDAADASPTLAGYRNKFVYVSSFLVNQQEMLASLQRVTSTSADDWTVTKVPVKEYFQEAVAQHESGKMVGFAKRLYSRNFFPDNAGNFEDTRGLDNDKLGLPKEDLDEFTKVAVELAESGYFDYEKGMMSS